ncbi:MAG TPA: DUF6232 family protein [Anaerolineales bacterium]|nr:DUF6232 family protein [Anaerolineales bacterium]
MSETNMKESIETTILKEGKVKVTSQKVIIGQEAYFISKIISARLHVKEPALFLPVFYMLTAAVCVALVAISNVDDYGHFLEVGLYFGIGAFLFFLLSTKTKYSVRVRSSLGELSLLEGSDRGIAERIVFAINKAIRSQQ